MQYSINNSYKWKQKRNAKRGTFSICVSSSEKKMVSPKGSSCVRISHMMIPYAYTSAWDRN